MSYAWGLQCKKMSPSKLYFGVRVVGVLAHRQVMKVSCESDVSRKSLNTIQMHFFAHVVVVFVDYVLCSYSSNPTSHYWTCEKLVMKILNLTEMIFELVAYFRSLFWQAAKSQTLRL